MIWHIIDRPGQVNSNIIQWHKFVPDDHIWVQYSRRDFRMVVLDMLAGIVKCSWSLVCMTSPRGTLKGWLCCTDGLFDWINRNCLGSIISTTTWHNLGNNMLMRRTTCVDNTLWLFKHNQDVNNFNGHAHHVSSSNHIAQNHVHALSCFALSPGVAREKGLPSKNCCRSSFKMYVRVYKS